MAGCNGFESFTEEDNELIGYCQESVFNLHSLKKILDEFPIPNIQITYSINKIEDKNWNEEWEKNGFNPIVIDNRCAVICKNTMESQSVQTLIAKIPMKVIIDAQQSFGTGTHETTQMIVSLLLNQDMQGKEFLIVGVVLVFWALLLPNVEHKISYVMILMTGVSVIQSITQS